MRLVTSAELLYEYAEKSGNDNLSHDVVDIWREGETEFIERYGVSKSGD